MRNTTLFASLLLLAPLSMNATTIDFEELDAADYPVANGNFESRGVTFLLNYNPDYFSWDGIALTNAGWKYSATSNYEDQYNLADANADVIHTAVINNYAVVYDPGAYGSTPEIDLPEDLYAPKSVKVTNTTYTWATMINGDSYGMSTPFATGAWFKLTATGYDANDEATGSTEFYLADYRDSDEAKHYALTQFTTVDLTPLGTGVRKIKFTLDSSDKGTYGINTPTYFAFDNLVIDGDRLWDEAETMISTWYGDIYAWQKGDGWIYSVDNQAFQYVTGTESSAWVYDEQLGWYWTSSDFYPYIYLSAIGSWAYKYEESPLSSDPRYYYIYDSALKDQLTNFPFATGTQLAGLAQ